MRRHGDLRRGDLAEARTKVRVELGLSIRCPNADLRGGSGHSKYKPARHGKPADGAGFSRRSIRSRPGGHRSAVGRKFLYASGAEVRNEYRVIRFRGNP